MARTKFIHMVSRLPGSLFIVNLTPTVLGRYVLFVCLKYDNKMTSRECDLQCINEKLILKLQILKGKNF